MVQHGSASKYDAHVLGIGVEASWYLSRVKRWIAQQMIASYQYHMRTDSEQKVGPPPWSLGNGIGTGAPK